MSAVPTPAPASAPKLERYRCNSCSYGISVAQPPTRCPMCDGKAWARDRRTSHAT